MKLTVIFIAILLVSQNAKCDELVCTINTKRAIHRVSDKFLSISIDPSVLLTGLNLSDKSLQLARHLSPAYIRVAGPSTQFVKYSLNDDKFRGHSSETANVEVTPSMWFGINEWLALANLTPVFGINDAATTTKGLWNPKPTLPMLELSDKLNMTCVWQLGFDSSNKTEMQYKGDLMLLRNIVDAIPSKKNSWTVVASDISRCISTDNIDAIEKTLQDLEGVADAVMWEPVTSNEYMFPEKDVMSKLLSYPVKRPVSVWTTAPRPSRSVSFATAILWMKQISEAATMGYDVIFRQPRLHEIFSESPAYWASLLYKNLMGRNVLDVKTSGMSSAVNVYAHCTKNQDDFSRRGAMSILVINNSTEEQTVQVKLGNTYQKSVEVQSYILTAPYEASPQVYLNDFKLSTNVFQGNQTVFTPRLRRAKVSKYLTLVVPSKSISFFVLPGARISACINDENEISQLLEEIEYDQTLPLFEENAVDIEPRITSTQPTLREMQRAIQKELEADERHYHEHTVRQRYEDNKADRLARRPSTATARKNNEIKSYYVDKSSDKRTDQSKVVNLELTSAEVKKILADRARARAAAKNIMFTDEELEELMKKASEKFIDKSNPNDKFRRKFKRQIDQSHNPPSVTNRERRDNRENRLQGHLRRDESATKGSSRLETLRNNLRSHRENRENSRSTSPRPRRISTRIGTEDESSLAKRLEARREERIQSRASARERSSSRAAERNSRLTPSTRTRNNNNDNRRTIISGRHDNPSSSLGHLQHIPQQPSQARSHGGIHNTGSTTQTIPSHHGLQQNHGTTHLPNTHLTHAQVDNAHHLPHLQHQDSLAAHHGLQQNHGTTHLPNTHLTHAQVDNTHHLPHLQHQDSLAAHNHHLAPPQHSDNHHLHTQQANGHYPTQLNHEYPSSLLHNQQSAGNHQVRRDIIHGGIPSRGTNFRAHGQNQHDRLVPRHKRAINMKLLALETGQLPKHEFKSKFQDKEMKEATMRKPDETSEELLKSLEDTIEEVPYNRLPQGNVLAGFATSDEAESEENGGEMDNNRKFNLSPIKNNPLLPTLFAKGNKPVLQPPEIKAAAVPHFELKLLPIQPLHQTHGDSKHILRHEKSVATKHDRKAEVELSEPLQFLTGSGGFDSIEEYDWDDFPAIHEYMNTKTKHAKHPRLDDVNNFHKAVTKSHHGMKSRILSHAEKDDSDYSKMLKDEDYGEIDSDEKPVRFKRSTDDAEKNEIKPGKKHLKEIRLKKLVALRKARKDKDRKINLHSRNKASESKTTETPNNSFGSDDEEPFGKQSLHFVIGDPEKAMKQKIDERQKEKQYAYLRSRLAHKKKMEQKKKSDTTKNKDKKLDETTTNSLNVESDQHRISKRSVETSNEIFKRYEPIIVERKVWKPSDIMSLKDKDMFLSNTIMREPLDDTDIFRSYFKKVKRSTDDDADVKENTIDSMVNDIIKESDISYSLRENEDYKPARSKLMSENMKIIKENEENTNKLNITDATVENSDILFSDELVSANKFETNSGILPESSSEVPVHEEKSIAGTRIIETKNCSLSELIDEALQDEEINTNAEKDGFFNKVWVGAKGFLKSICQKIGSYFGLV